MSQNHAILDAAKTRYSCKAFDPSKKISDADFAQLQDILRMTPSSVNTQPWHFIVASTDQGKTRMAKGAQGPFAYNEPKITNASHVILFCVKTELEDAHLEALLDQEEADGRYRDAAGREMVKNVRGMYIGMHKNQFNDLPAWIEKQTYIGLGALLLAAGAMNIDTVAMEGVDVDALDTEFDLSSKGLRAIVAVGLGYRSEADFNAKLPKSRLSADVIFTQV